MNIEKVMKKQRKEQLEWLLKLFTSKYLLDGEGYFHGTTSDNLKDHLETVKKHYKENPQDIESDYMSYMC